MNIMTFTTTSSTTFSIIKNESLVKVIIVRYNDNREHFDAPGYSFKNKGEVNL